MSAPEPLPLFGQTWCFFTDGTMYVNNLLPTTRAALGTDGISSWAATRRAGRANRKLSAREAAVLTVWLADLNEALRCRRTGDEPVLQGEFAR